MVGPCRFRAREEDIPIFLRLDALGKIAYTTNSHGLPIRNEGGSIPGFLVHPPRFPQRIGGMSPKRVVTGAYWIT